MEKNKTTEALTTVIGAGAKLVEGGGNNSPQLTAMLERLARLLENDLQEQQIEKLAKAEVKRKAVEAEQHRRREILKTLEQGKREEEAIHAACQHRSGPPWNQTELRGYYMISGALHLTCQACGKYFDTPESINWVKSKGLFPGGPYAPAAAPQPIYS